MDNPWQDGVSLLCGDYFHCEISKYFDPQYPVVIHKMNDAPLQKISIENIWCINIVDAPNFSNEIFVVGHHSCTSKDDIE